MKFKHLIVSTVMTAFSLLTFAAAESAPAGSAQGGGQAREEGQKRQEGRAR